jgi:hypothetical protein
MTASAAVHGKLSAASRAAVRPPRSRSDLYRRPVHPACPHRHDATRHQPHRGLPAPDVPPRDPQAARTMPGRTSAPPGASPQPPRFLRREAGRTTPSHTDAVPAVVPRTSEEQAKRPDRHRRSPLPRPIPASPGPDPPAQATAGHGQVPTRHAPANHAPANSASPRPRRFLRRCSS